MNLFLARFKDVINAIIIVDSKVGFKKFVKYTVFILIVISILNIRAVFSSAIEFVNDVSEEIHAEKIEKRDKYMLDLSPLLTELRVSIGADRLLYFEYHNSDSNLDGLPFKFFDLMKCDARYGISDVDSKVYKDIGAGMYPELFEAINTGKILYCSGDGDYLFKRNYPGVYEFFHNTDKSNQQVFFGIPGTRKPKGFIVAQWRDKTKRIDVDTRKITEFLPRISAISK